MIAGHQGRYGLLDERAKPEQSKRRRWAALGVILAVAVAGALLGQMSTDRGDSTRPAPPGPFDTLPH